MLRYFLRHSNIKIIAILFVLFLQFAHATITAPTLIAIHDSDENAFVQGFEVIKDDKLLMATGLYGKSFIGVFDLATQRYTIKDTLPAEFFGEGATVTPYGIWQLTWRENTAFLRSLQDLRPIHTKHYDTEGWGLAYDDANDHLYMSDGTSKLQIRNAQTFELISTLPVRYHGKDIKFINELEFANGFIYANIWQTNFIIKIDPKNGNISQIYDVSNLLSTHLNQRVQQNIDVLNGIAHIKNDRFYITGKFYPVIFEVELP